MTMHKALHSRDDIDRLYVSKEERRLLTSSEDSVDTSIRRLEDYIKKTNCSDQKQHKQHNDQQNNKNGKKNYYMDISSDKQVKCLTRRLKHG